MQTKLERKLTILLEKTVQRLGREKGLSTPPPVFLDFPREKAHGEFSTNIAFALARKLKTSPIELANLISDSLKAQLGSPLKEKIKAIEVKKPGFINFVLTQQALAEVLTQIQRSRENFGRFNLGRRRAVQVEFVSANPTGPLSVAHGRQAAIGDSLANILAFCGYRVTREYYLNDEGTQIDLLGRSVRARYQELKGEKAEFPQGGYRGEYIMEVARKVADKFTSGCLRTRDGSAAFFAGQAVKIILVGIKKDLQDFGVKFNVWCSQKRITHSRTTERVFSRLKKRDYLYQKDGALWFRSSRFGDDKDRVVVKSDGATTYLWADIAYHYHKYRRGFKWIINLWGPDHHGYVSRMKAAVQALGYPADSLTLLIVQLATLYRGGTPVPMSTRVGEFITLREVMNEVGKDACRFFFLMRRTSSHLDFDLELAKRQSLENPVYYIQYAHARIWSIIGFAGVRRIKLGRGSVDFSRLDSVEEIEVLRLLARFPWTVRSAAESTEPYRIVAYLQTLAASFHQFYTRHRVVTEDGSLTAARLMLVDSVRIVLANGLRLLGISAPRKM